MRPVHYISNQGLDLHRIERVLHQKSMLVLSKESESQIAECREVLERKLALGDKIYYGINTGFGALCDVRISHEEMEKLQENLVKSHAAGVGEEVPQEVVRIMLLLKIQSLALGYSGVRRETVQALADFFNYDLLPVVYQQGSLGASGDLAPLAHLSLPLLGLGEVYANGRKMPAAHALNQLFWKPLRLQEKEGLALLNGTQFSAAYTVWCLIQANKLMRIANACGALACEAFLCHTSPFDPRLHRIRPHSGQIAAAAAVRDWREGSILAGKEKFHVQDPYAFRCIPQVHGASFDAIAHVEQVALTEINSVTDNPIIFSESGDILSGGNFHAQPLALTLDYLGLALSELGSISERRVFQLLCGLRGLPAFLTPQPGLNSGLMIAQYTAASIVSQNKQLCSPASVDSIVSSNGQEDHVSMAANAATKTWRIVQNLKNILAIEWMTAAQAMEFRRPEATSPRLESQLSRYREVLPVLDEDRILSHDIQKTVAFLMAQEF
jgi:histidine ammonia-lyase